MHPLHKALAGARILRAGSNRSWVWLRTRLIDRFPVPDASAPSLWSSAGARRLPVLIGILLAAGSLVLGFLSPIVHLRTGTSGKSYSVLTGILDLVMTGNVLLGSIVFAFSVVFPIFKLSSLLGILFTRLDEARQRRALRSLTVLGRWSMLDVFVIVILVGALRLGILAQGRPLSGIYVFGAAILMSMLSTLAVGHLATRRFGPPPAPDLSATRSLLGRVRPVVAFALFLVGLSLPLMSVEKWWFWENEYSLLRGTLAMARSGEPVLAAGVLAFVVLVPAARFLALAVVPLAVAGRTPRSERAARALLWIDEWAMLDVFGLALLIVVVKIGDLATVRPLEGFWVLLAAVCLSGYDSWKLHSAKGTS